jgi:hypothetical protein
LGILEKNLWKRLKKGIKELDKKAHFERQEDYLNHSPDVDYCIKGVCGKIELKVMNSWPQKGPLRIKHLTIQQINWHRAYAKSGGKSFFLLQVGKDFFLHKGTAEIKALTQTQHKECALLYESPKLNYSKVLMQLIT